MSNETHPHEETPLEQPETDLPVVEPTVAPEILDPEPAVEEPAVAEAPESIIEESTASAESPHAADLISLLQENLALTRKLDEMSKKVAEAATKVEEAQRGELLAQADYQNFRRRSEERFTEQQKYNNAEFIKALLPVLDNFERAMTAAEQSQNFDALVNGVKGTLKQLQSALQKAGVTSIEAVGKEFDPKYHEAIGHAESDEYPSNTVAEEVQRGYILHDRVLRPTLVRVTD